MTTTATEAKELPYYQRFVRAFEIFGEYEESSFLSAEHDIIYAGPAVSAVTPEHLAELRALGWSTDEEDSFYHFV